MDESRRRRRERLAQRRDVPRPPAAEPQQGRALRARAAATNRDGRFEHRLERVRQDVARRERRQQQLRLLRLVGLGVTGLLVVLVAEAFVGLGPALAIGVGVVAVAEVGRRVTTTAAARRGASAWDWQAGRHRLFGRPAERVQMADRPSEAGSPLDPRQVDRRRGR